MPVQNSSVLTITLPLKIIMELKDSNCELQKEYKKSKTNEKVLEQTIKILRAEKIALENECTKLKGKKNEKETLIQVLDDDLQSSKRVTQCICVTAGAILGGGLVLAFPPAGIAIALGGTGSMAAGTAIAGGVTGGCLVAPIIHEKTHKASIQQVQNFKAKEKVSKKAE